MSRALVLFFVAAGFAAAAPMTYTLTGTGSGYWNSQQFSNAAFTFTFTADTSTIVHGTSCCGSTDSTPSGTTATVSVAGFSPAQLTGDQAIFMDHPNATAGIWHFNAAQYLTVTNQAFSGNNVDLTTTDQVSSAGSTAWAYATPFPLSSGGDLYFTSVQNVSYSQGPPSGGLPYTTSVTPNSGSQALNSTQTYTFLVGDSEGVSDLAGVDLQFGDGGSTCWLFFNPNSNMIAMNHQNNWGPLTPIGSGGSTLTGNACTVNTAAVTATPSGNNLSLAIPVQITIGDNNTVSISAAAQNKEGSSTPYTQLGTVTVEGSGNSQGSFTLSVSPTDQVVPAGGSANFIVTMTDQNGFNQPVTFNATAKASQLTGGDPSQLYFAFNPATLTTSGNTTLTVTAASGATPASYSLMITGVAQAYTQSTDAGIAVQNGPPQLTLSPTSGTGSSATLTITWPDFVNTPSFIDLLIAPSLDGSHACWIYYSGDIYLASDDGSSWTDAYHVQDPAFGTPTTGPGASNSQCSFAGPPTLNSDSLGPRSGHNTLTIPLTFTPAFDGTKTVYTDAADAAGYDSGYQPMGGWTVQ